jgi:D-alanine--poly(phosphoribitol) ligase subunit 1
MDNQIKLHGYRIELGDIEANLMQCQDVEQAAVIPKYEDGVIKSLVAFVKAPNLDGQFKDVKYIKEQLKEKLPAYMIPKNIKFLDSMPITANGKLDRNKLKEGAL